MSKARDLGNLLDTGGDVVSGSLDNVPTPSKTSIEALGIDVPAANLTGTIANARIDLTPVHQSIATLGLHMGVSANAAAFNLPNAFIDTFEDNTGTTTRTDVSNVDEYFATVYSSSTLLAYDLGTEIGNLDGSVGRAFNGDETDIATASGAVNPTCGGKDWGVGNTKILDRFWINNTAAQGFSFGGSTTTIKLQGSTDNFSSSIVDLYSTGTISDAPNSFVEVTSGIITTTAYRYHRLHLSPIVTDARVAEIKFWELASSANATGTLISDTQTAPAATTEVSGVILYKDNAGTATLGTELKIYFTANNGTNWTEASSYGTAQTFSGTTKQVKLGKTTVTSGTQVAMKAVWASQVSDSMETQLHGWAVNY